MVTLYTGTPGSGKSLHLISLIIRVLNFTFKGIKDRQVICNFPITFTDKEKAQGMDKRFHYWTNEEITVNAILEFAIEHDHFIKKRESQTLVIIDEAGGRFNSRDYSNKDRSEWIDFFSQHRKAGFDFILVAQQDRMIDRQIRGFVETEKRHRKINNFGPFWLLPFPVFVCIEDWYTAKQRVGSEFFLYHKKIAERYDSFKMFEGFKLSPKLMAKIADRQKSQEEKEAADLIKEQHLEEVFPATNIVEEVYNVSINSIFKEADEK